MASIIGKFSVPATQADLEEKSDTDHRHEITDVRLLGDTLGQVGEAIDQLESCNLVGDGFPEGKVAAPVGAVYTDSLATNGAIRWIKASGTNTWGWRVEYGDTGWRDISELADPAWEGALHVRRDGPLITVNGVNLRPPGTGTQTVVEMPPGFRPSKTSLAFGGEDSTSRPLYALNYSPYRLEYRYLAKSRSWCAFTTQFYTNDPWPTALPGTPS